MKNTILNLLPSRPSLIEPLEQRIAPAGLLDDTGSRPDGLPVFTDAVVNSALLVKAGHGLTSGGSYLLYVQQGQALVFTSDLNGNNQVDFDEITGIAAGDHLKMISFIDIHGDIVTNLNPDGGLSDSDGDATNGRDGQVLLNNHIDKIELRTLKDTDINNPGQVLSHVAQSSYSIFGNIYAGAGVGTTDGTGGVIIDTSNKVLQQDKFPTAGVGFVDSPPTLGSIKTGSAVTGEFFNFGTLGVASDQHGEIKPFFPQAGATGGDIIGVKSNVALNIGNLQTGNGGFNARGGNIQNISIPGDLAGGYSLITGNGGPGNVGTPGGSILNFADLGSITSTVVLRTGNGGLGLLGKGGDGGAITFSSVQPVSIAADFQIFYGNGADGFTSGGNGAGMSSGTFTTPEVIQSFALTFVSTTRAPGDIGYADQSTGNVHTFDFDGDGFSDAVYTTRRPDQLVVVFGDGTGAFDDTRNIYLNGPANAQGLVVADFNGDGHPDIATASATASNAGIETFLSRYDGAGTFTGFRDPLYSPLPSLNSFLDVDFNPYLEQAVPVTRLAAIGITDPNTFNTQMGLAIATTQSNGHDVIIVLRNSEDPSHPNGTGYFYTDFQNAAPLVPFADIGASTSTLLKPTALSVGGQDIFIAATVGGTALIQFDYSPTTGLRVPTFIPDGFSGVHPLGSVDTNRDISDPGKTDKISLSDATTVLDFTILDIDGDGNADIAALSKQPEGFLVTFKGDGATFNVASNPNFSGENSGIKISGNPDKNDVGIAITNQKLVGILSTNADGMPTSTVNDIALIDYTTTGNFGRVIEVVFNPINPFAAVTPGAPPVKTPLSVNAQFFFFHAGSPDATILAFDTFLPDPVTNPDVVGYGVGEPVKSLVFPAIETVGDFLGGFSTLIRHGYTIVTGDGGNGLTGAGGNSGGIGTGLLAKGTDENGNAITTGSVTITLPGTEIYAGIVRLVTGDGGDGFTNGGSAGSMSGVSVDYANASVLSSVSLLVAGNGGRALTGTGGTGGSLSALHVSTGDLFVAGNGGPGVIGGNGGSINGNTLTGVTDTDTVQGVNGEVSFIALFAGQGGDGMKRAGHGGKIQHWVSHILPLANNGIGGHIEYHGGAGGNAVGGPGGDGGAITDSSPFSADNNLGGEIFVQGGDGGTGTTGGNGGGISNFKNSPTIPGTPNNASFIAGNGGIGTSGSGGAGGSTSTLNFTTSGVGDVYDFDLSDPLFPTATITVNGLVFSRVIAGTGGDSYGSNGGAGGSVSGLVGTATGSSFAVAAGRGGDGLALGGTGGSVSNANVNSAGRFGVVGDIGKVLIIAGEGGDASASAPTGASNTDIALSIGGTAAKGGNGGGISGFTQPDAVHTNVDLIAGNGGSTPHDGTVTDLSPKVGKGGSITGASIAGNIGNVANTLTAPEFGAEAAIQAYNDISAGERVADFVRDFLVASPGVPLDDTIGNVGLVAGAAGYVKDANGDETLEVVGAGVNGSVSGVHARNIMSMVAGSVDRIASIQSLSNFGVTSNGGILGADKDIDSFGRNDDGHGHMYVVGLPPEYLTVNDMVTGVFTSSADPGTKLVDGAIVAKNETGVVNPRVFKR